MKRWLFLLALLFVPKPSFAQYGGYQYSFPMPGFYLNFPEFTRPWAPPVPLQPPTWYPVPILSTMTRGEWRADYRGDWWAVGNTIDVSGANPEGGYDPETVAVLSIIASPGNAIVSLDGVPLGPASQLGPIQCPLGTYRVKVEAEGFVASERSFTLNAVELKQLQVSLMRKADHGIKPTH